MSQSTIRFWLASLLVCSLFALPCSAQAASQHDYRETLGKLSQEMHGQLADLRRQSETLTTQLAIAENDLRLSHGQVSALQTELTELNSCLASTNRKLADYSTKLTEYELKLRQKQRLIRLGLGLIVLFVLVRIALALLKLKFGIKIPYWVNLIL